MIIAILGKSCSGKDTIVQKLAEEYRNDSRVSIAKSYTTRPKRIDEEDGKEYHFVTDDEYKKMLYEEKNLVVNTVFFVGENVLRYGITKEELQKSDINIVILNPYSIGQLKRSFSEKEIFTILLEVPKTKRILRYFKRDTFNLKNIKNCFRRAKADDRDFKKLNVDYTLENKEVNNTVNYIKDIINVELGIIESTKCR